MWTKLSPPLSLSFCICEMGTISTRLLVAFSYSKCARTHKHTYMHTHTHTHNHIIKNEIELKLPYDPLDCLALLWVPRTRARIRVGEQKRWQFSAQRKVCPQKRFFSLENILVACWMLDILIDLISGIKTSWGCPSAFFPRSSLEFKGRLAQDLLLHPAPASPWLGLQSWLPPGCR